MTKTLFLTADERTLFETLPDNLCEGWEMKEESGAYRDSDRQRVLRCSLLNFTDPKLIALQKSVINAKTPRELLRQAGSFDFSKASPSDMAELFFAIGPDGLSLLISGFLLQAKDQSTMCGIALLANARHEFFATAPATFK